MIKRISLSIFVLFVCSIIVLKVTANNLHLDKIELPSGFKIELYVDNIPNARAMALGDKGTLFVGSRSAGKVYAVFAPGTKNQKMYTLAEDLEMPVGVAFKDGDLYVSAVHQILKFEAIESRLDNPPNPVVVNDTFPKDTHHGWKFIAFGPDNKLYVPVGAPCNICLPEDNRYASIMRMDKDGSDLEIFAHGVRNTVGFDWHPTTKQLWFTDNGRDWMGDDLPPDELNTAPQIDMHFGYPFCHGGNIKDPKFGDMRSCEEFSKPSVNLGPHVAALGMRFYTGTMFPQKYHNKIFIAEHGSWNRSDKIGYRITFIDSDKQGQDQYEVFAKGWLESDGFFTVGGGMWGRPVDILVMPDGALLVSDDHAGVIYRISYTNS